MDNKKMRRYFIGGITLFLIFITGVNADIPVGSSTGTLELNNSCVDCHKTISPSTDVQNTFNNIIVNHTERNITCSISCHKDVMKHKVIDNFQQWSDSIHAKYFITCDNCHGGNPNGKSKLESHVGILNSTDPNSTIYFANIPEICGKCHTEELNNFQNTMHYQRLKAESLAPSCITCHPPHTFKVPVSDNIITLCSRCHNPTTLPSLSSIPGDAKRALDKAQEFQDLIVSTKKFISESNGTGGDVSTAQLDLDNAISIKNDIPSMWHSFNLKIFDQQIQNGINLTVKAKNDIGDAATSPPKVSGVPIYIILVIFVLSVFAIKKMRQR